MGGMQLNRAVMVMVVVVMLLMPMAYTMICG
jgi:hypothetical protein